MPLGMEVGLGPGDIVLDEDPAPPPTERGTAAPLPLFDPCLLWPDGCPSQQLLSSCFIVTAASAASVNTGSFDSVVHAGFVHLINLHIIIAVEHISSRNSSTIINSKLHYSDFSFISAFIP